MLVWDADGTARDIASTGRCSRRYVDAGTYPVVLANKFGGVIFHEACGHLLETTQLERGTSPLLDGSVSPSPMKRSLPLMSLSNRISAASPWMTRA